MMRMWRYALVLAALAGLPACQSGEQGSAAEEAAQGTSVPDRPAPAISDPASPTPVGTDVGTLERDTSASPVADDSMAIPGR